MTTLLNTKRIRTSTPAQLTEYYNEVRAQTPDEDITAQLLRAVDIGSISPAAVAPWLGLTKSPVIMKRALQQNHSILIRQFAIKYFRKRLHSSTWRDAWTGVGGTPGMLEIFADLSVIEIRTMCKALSRCAKGNDIKEKREHITELFKGLHPGTYVDAKYQTSDRRPLAKHYGLLLPACSQNLIEVALTEDLKGVWKHAKLRDLLEHCPAQLGQRQISRLADNETKSINQEHIKVLTNRYSTATLSNPRFSPSMNYSLTCLRILVSVESSKMDDTIVVNNIIRPLLSRSVRKRVDWERILEIVDLTLKYFEKNPTAGKMINPT
ncbi:hypothetical protein T440DRAFT_522026 [Plenodomus tracheiphilus IPT5]|uniref:Uncharacterized protein n=1 Tax=Plenodomus tracheiphilus IPT5 TaxID=1408161 RepID=A0A6A7AV62_9PLEO|nr:hypothetical protein T440DRAFT_522026 [Plenodomus tracheiphilus IPT5]